MVNRYHRFDSQERQTHRVSSIGTMLIGRKSEIETTMPRFKISILIKIITMHGMLVCMMETVSVVERARVIEKSHITAMTVRMVIMTKEVVMVAGTSQAAVTKIITTTVNSHGTIMIVTARVGTVTGAAVMAVEVMTDARVTDASIATTTIVVVIEVVIAVLTEVATRAGVHQVVTHRAAVEVDADHVIHIGLDATHRRRQAQVQLSHRQAVDMGVCGLGHHQSVQCTTVTRTAHPYRYSTWIVMNTSIWTIIKLIS